MQTLWQVSLKQHYEIKNTSDPPLGQKLLQRSIIETHRVYTFKWTFTKGGLKYENMRTWTGSFHPVTNKS